MSQSAPPRRSPPPSPQGGARDPAAAYSSLFQRLQASQSELQPVSGGAASPLSPLEKIVCGRFVDLEDLAQAYFGRAGQRVSGGGLALHAGVDFPSKWAADAPPLSPKRRRALCCPSQSLKRESAAAKRPAPPAEKGQPSCLSWW